MGERVDTTYPNIMGLKKRNNSYTRQGDMGSSSTWARNDGGLFHTVSVPYL